MQTLECTCWAAHVAVPYYTSSRHVFTAAAEAAALGIRLPWTRQHASASSPGSRIRSRPSPWPNPLIWWGCRRRLLGWWLDYYKLLNPNVRRLARTNTRRHRRHTDLEVITTQRQSSAFVSCCTVRLTLQIRCLYLLIIINHFNQLVKYVDHSNFKESVILK